MDYPKIVFRTDGSTSIGLGHVMRCIALGHMLRHDLKDIAFYLMSPDSAVYTLIKNEGFQVFAIDNEEQFLMALKGGEIVVLDGYHLTSIQSRVKDAGCSLACIDDLHEGHFVADLLINQAPGVKKEEYRAEKYTRFLLGTDFALLRPNFLQLAKSERKIAKLENVLVCFGGSDYKNLTKSVLEMVVRNEMFKTIVAITGVGYPFRRDLAEYASSSGGRIVHLHGVDGAEMAKCLLRVELAIVPASGVLFEVIASKTPAISGYYVNNQQLIYEGFKSSNAFYDAKDFSQKNVEYALGLAMHSDPNEQIEKQSRCIDGKSRERYIEAFMLLANQSVT